MYEYRALVLGCVDGDTVDLDVDLGFYLRSTLRFRLQGINAPERWQEGGTEATEWLRSMLEGQEVTIRTEKADSFGRWVALIKRDGDALSINARMVREGHAVLYTNRYAAPVEWT